MDSTNDLNGDGIYDVAALIGSLRQKSLNRGLFEAAVAVQPPSLRLTEAPIGALPLYNEDVEREGDPAPVRALKDQLLAADAVLIFTPEYNQSIPGGLKNAIDWASRPYGQGQVLNGKPVAFLGASSGKVGTARAQLELRRILPYLGMYVLPKPEIYVGPPEGLFDDESRLIDEKTKGRLGEQLSTFLEWIKVIRAGAA